jgi:hypothetical protein
MPLGGIPAHDTLAITFGGIAYCHPPPMSLSLVGIECRITVSK